MKYLRIIAYAGFLLPVSSLGQVKEPCPAKPPALAPTQFDLEHDHDDEDNASFSCSLGIRASQADAALQSFRAGVLQNDLGQLRWVMRFPISVVLPPSHRRGAKRRIVYIKSVEEWTGLAKKYLTRYQLNEIKEASLRHTSIVNSRLAGPGFILDYGIVFFSALDSRHIWIKHINLERVVDDPGR